MQPTNRLSVSVSIITHTLSCSPQPRGQKRERKEKKKRKRHINVAHSKEARRVLALVHAVCRRQHRRLVIVVVFVALAKRKFGRDAKDGGVGLVALLADGPVGAGRVLDDEADDAADADAGAKGAVIVGADGSVLEEMTTVTGLWSMGGWIDECRERLGDWEKERKKLT
jgi:hypothetical protein